MILTMKDICKDYPMGKNVVKVLKDVNLTIDEGEYAAIMGPSGSGKTTLMNLIGFLDTPTSGEYIFDGELMNNKSDNQLAEVRNKDIGFIFQSFNLLPKLSAQENVALPLLYAGVKKKERLERAEEALVTMGLQDRIKFSSDQLSGGQCQRVAIARALALDPEILLFDEPTSALDPRLTQEVLAVMRDLALEKRTMVVVTHEMGFARDVADKIVFMENGVVVDAGTPEKVLGSGACEQARAFLGQI